MREGFVKGSSQVRSQLMLKPHAVMFVFIERFYEKSPCAQKSFASPSQFPTLQSNATKPIDILGRNIKLRIGHGGIGIGARTACRGF